MRNSCQLITYPDSLGGDLPSLLHLFKTRLAEVVTGVHILPFYPSSADRGFAPITYYEVDPAFGTWEDIEAIGKGHDLTVDFMFNHISRQSEYFKDFLEKKDVSEYRDFFIRFSEFWPGRNPTEEDLAKVYTRKPRPPYTEGEFADGSRERLWCTFDDEQIDLNQKSPKAREFTGEVLRFLCEKGARMIRLDAFAYATKRPGTSCFFLEPDVWELLAYARKIVAPYGVEILPEIHEHYTIQLKLAQRGYWVYDFALPMLLLQAVYDGHTGNLKRWLSICPRKQFTTLDTHDGIGVVDVEDLMGRDEIEGTKENLYRRGAKVKRIYNTPRYQNLDVYQLNCTYYSALGNNGDLYLLARAVQFFCPGIPLVYYVGLLAGENDIELLERTRVGRNINRHNYSPEEVEENLKRDVVRKLFELMRFRNSHPAFSGTFQLLESSYSVLKIKWSRDAHWASLEADFLHHTFRIVASDRTFISPSSV